MYVGCDLIAKRLVNVSHPLVWVNIGSADTSASTCKLPKLIRCLLRFCLVQLNDGIRPHELFAWRM